MTTTEIRTAPDSGAPLPGGGPPAAPASADARTPPISRRVRQMGEGRAPSDRDRPLQRRGRPQPRSPRRRLLGPPRGRLGRARGRDPRGEPRWARVRRRPLRSGGAARPPRRLGDHGRRPRRGRAALPAVLAGGPVDDPEPRRHRAPQRRRSAGGALAGLHGGRRAPAAARRAGRERARPPELGRRQRADGLLRVAPRPRLHASTRASSTPSSTAFRSTARACSSSACGTAASSSGRSPRRRSRRCATRSATCRRCRPRSGRSASRTSGPRTAFQRRMRDGCRAEDAQSVHDHITRDVRPDDAEAFALLGEGQTYVDLPEHLRRYRSDIFTDKYKRLAWDEVSRSITAHIAKDGYWYIHPEQHRTLSVREAARVQTFPDWFRFAGQPTPQAEADRQRRPAAARRGARAAAPGRARGDAREPAPSDRSTSGRVCSSGTRDIDATTRGGRGGLDPWLVLAAELCLARTRADLVPVIYERAARLAPSPARCSRSATRSPTLEALGLGARAEIARRRRASARANASTARCRRPSSSCARCRASATTSRRPCCASGSGGGRCCSTSTTRATRRALSAADRTRAAGSSGSTCTGSRAARARTPRSTTRCSTTARSSAARSDPLCDECPLRSGAPRAAGFRRASAARR